MNYDNTRELFRELFMPREATARTDIITPADVWGNADIKGIKERLYRYAPLLADYVIDSAEVVNDLLSYAQNLIPCNPPWTWLTGRLEVGTVVVTTWLGELRVGEVVWNSPCSAQRGPDDKATYETIVWWLSPNEALSVLGSDLRVVDVAGHNVTE